MLGIGFTVIVKASTELPHEKKGVEELTKIVELIGAFVGLVATKFKLLLVPEAPSPMDVFELVQKTAPQQEVPRTSAIGVPLQTTMLLGTMMFS